MVSYPPHMHRFLSFTRYACFRTTDSYLFTNYGVPTNLPAEILYRTFINPA